MKNKQLLIAVVVLIVLGAVVFSTKENSGKSSSSGESTKPTNQVIETLDATKLASITLTDSDDSVSVNQVDGKWSVTNRDGFPANFSNIQSLVDTVTELKILAKQKVGKSQLGRFELNDPATEDTKDAGTKLELKDADGNVLHSVLFGKETQGQSDPSSPFGPSGTGRYVLVPPNTVGEINETLSSDLKTSPADWLHKEDFLKVEKIKSITIKQPKEADSWTRTRIKEGDDMALSEAKSDEKLDSSKGNSAAALLPFEESSFSSDFASDSAISSPSLMRVRVHESASLGCLIVIDLIFSTLRKSSLWSQSAGLVLRSLLNVSLISPTVFGGTRTYLPVPDGPKGELGSDCPWVSFPNKTLCRTFPSASFNSSLVPASLVSSVAGSFNSKRPS